MFKNATSLLCGVALFAATCLAGIPYTSMPLGPTPDQPQSVPVASSLNNAGQVAGYEYPSSGSSSPVVWNAGVPSALPMPSGYELLVDPGQTSSLPGIDQEGQVLARAKNTATGSQAGILWTNGVPLVIGPAPSSCGAGDAVVKGLNAAGHVVGATGSRACRVFWVWNQGAYRILNPPKPKRFELAGINDADHVFGSLCQAKAAREGCFPGGVFELRPGKKFVYYKGRASGLGVPNNLDQVTGWAEAGPGSDAFLWMSPSSVVGIPPTRPYADQAVDYSNVNNAQDLIFVRAGGLPYAIQHGNKEIGQVTGDFSANQPIAGINDGLQFLAGPNLITPAPASCAIDVTSQVTVTPGAVHFDKMAGRFRQSVTVTNNGAALTGPVSLLLNQLSPAVSVYRLRGSTVCAAPAGTPYVRLPDSFGGPGSSAAIHLQFIAQSAGDLAWTPSVLAGAGGR